MAEARSDESESEDERCSSYADDVRADESSKDKHDEDEKRILHEKEIREYFRVDLMYQTRLDEWPDKTCLQYKLSLNSQTGQSEQSMFREWPFTKSDRLFNVGNQHAELILLKDLEDLLSSFESTEESYMLQSDEVSYMLEKLQLESPAHHASSRKDKEKLKVESPAHHASSRKDKEKLKVESPAHHASSRKDKEKLKVESPAHHASSRKDKKMMKMNLKIVINYSPCKNCADQIERFKKNFEKNYEIHISITFGSFYKFYPRDDKTKNKEGLANLQNAGIKLRLVWDSESLKKEIKKIGTKKERKERKKKDREYMKLVEEKAIEIAD